MAAGRRPGTARRVVAFEGDGPRVGQARCGLAEDGLAGGGEGVGESAGEQVEFWLARYVDMGAQIPGMGGAGRVYTGIYRYFTIPVYTLRNTRAPIAAFRPPGATNLLAVV